MVRRGRGRHAFCQRVFEEAARPRPLKICEI